MVDDQISGSIFAIDSIIILVVKKRIVMIIIINFKNDNGGSLVWVSVKFTWAMTFISVWWCVDILGFL